MLRRWLVRLVVGLLLAAAVAFTLTVHYRVEAQDLQSEQGAPVVFDGQVLFSLSGKAGQYTAQERALLIEKRLVSLAEARQTTPASIRIVDLAAESDIFVGDVRLLTITEEDAALAGRTRQEVVTDDANRIRHAISQFRDKWSPKRRLLGGLYAFLTTALFVLVVSALRRLRRKLRDRIEQSGQSTIAHHKIRGQELIASTQYKSFLTALVGIGYWALFLVLLAIFFPF